MIGRKREFRLRRLAWSGVRSARTVHRRSTGVRLGEEEHGKVVAQLHDMHSHGRRPFHLFPNRFCLGLIPKRPTQPALNTPQLGKSRALPTMRSDHATKQRIPQHLAAPSVARNVSREVVQ